MTVKEDADALLENLQRRVSEGWEQGKHPLSTSLSLRQGVDIMEIVVRLADKVSVFDDEPVVD